jgi:hypothetical protein
MDTGIPNIDAMNVDELIEFRSNVMLLDEYAMHKRYAIEYRLAGDIVFAQNHERVCERIYNRLPAWARW